MNKTKLIIYITCLLALAFFVTFFGFFGRKLVFTSELVNQRDNIIALKDTINADDYMIYWVGEVPSRLNDLKITILNMDNLKEEDLPLKNVRKQTVGTITKEDGTERKVNQWEYFEQECPAHSFIVINNVADIPAEKRKMFERCAAESATVVLVIGKDAVDAYRTYLIRPTGIGYEYGSMLVDFAADFPTDILDAEKIKDTNSVDFTVEFLEYLSKKLGH